ncbi:MAG: nucleotidyltransferase family protein [Actinomycetota bacterium]
MLEATGQQLGSSPGPSKSRGRNLGRLIRAHRDSIIAIAGAHHASNVRVFGSVARGRARPGSDIDLLVDMDRDASLLDQVRLRRALQELPRDRGRRCDVSESSTTRFKHPERGPSALMGRKSRRPLDEILAEIDDAAAAGGCITICDTFVSWPKRSPSGWTTRH